MLVPCSMYTNSQQAFFSKLFQHRAGHLARTALQQLHIADHACDWKHLQCFLCAASASVIHDTFCLIKVSSYCSDRRAKQHIIPKFFLLLPPNIRRLVEPFLQVRIREMSATDCPRQSTGSFRRGSCVCTRGTKACCSYISFQDKRNALISLTWLNKG